MSNFAYKRFSDPIHKTIGLSRIETSIIDTPVFQRLRNVRQLGLVSYAFPGTDYSRFDHSLGVCHITGKILSALKLSGVQIKDEEIQLYRLAALLHDVGHYPFSHIMQDAIDNFYKAGLIVPEGGAKTAQEEDGGQSRPFSHERVGREILRVDPLLRGILDKHKYEPDQISSIFMREEPPKFANLISSDLDADRIDHLLRTAHHTGLPYGSVDIDYLMSQMAVDKDEKIAVADRALRAAEHLLLCRYFVFQQIIYHKTVVAFEKVLGDVFSALLSSGLIDCSSDWVSSSIQDGRWSEFDDVVVVQKIRELHESADDIQGLKTSAVLFRRPPSLVAEREELRPDEDTYARDFRLKKQIIREHIPIWAEKFGIDKSLWYFWERSGHALTKIGSAIPVSAREDVDSDLYEQAVRIMKPGTSESIPIMNNHRSLMSVMANYRVYSLRIYVLIPDDMKGRRKEIEEFIRGDLPDL